VTLRFCCCSRLWPFGVPSNPLFFPCYQSPFWTHPTAILLSSCETEYSGFRAGPPSHYRPIGHFGFRNGGSSPVSSIVLRVDRCVFSFFLFSLWNSPPAFSPPLNFCRFVFFFVIVFPADLDSFSTILGQDNSVL